MNATFKTHQGYHLSMGTRAGFSTVEVRGPEGRVLKRIRVTLTRRDAVALALEWIDWQVTQQATWAEQIAAIQAKKGSS